MYRSTCYKYPPPEQLHEELGLRFYVVHLHDGNDPDWTERSLFGTGKYAPRYVTVCRIKDEEGHELGYGEAVCSDKDVPNRKLGHEIAVSRAIKNYFQQKHSHEQAQQQE